MSLARERWAVLGGGLLGMTLAHRLARAGRAVTLYEAAPELGGLASAWTIGDVVWDRHYHVTLLSDSALRAVWKEIGVEPELRWSETKTGFYTDGRLHSMSNTVEFLRFPPLGLVSKLRLGATIFFASRRTDWQALEKIPVERWLRAWSGGKTFEKIWLPLLRSKLGEHYRETSAAFLWATIQRMYAARKTGLKKEMFGYVSGGYARVVEKFAETLRGEGVELRLGARVAEIARTGTELGVRLDGEQEPARFDRVVATVASPLAARLCRGLAAEEEERLRGVRYLGIVCASVLLDRPLADFYVTNLTDEGLPFTAVIEMTTLVDRKELGGKALVYLPRYAAADEPIFAESDGSIEERFLAALERMYPGFRREHVRAFRVSRVKEVFALSTLGYSERLPPIDTSVPGLHLVSSAHVVNGTLNVNETIQLAESCAKRWLGEGARPS